MRPMSDPSKSGLVATLRYRDVAGALEWLGSAFGFETEHVVKDQDGSIRYAMLAHGSDTIMLLAADDLNAATGINGSGADSGPSLQSCYCIIDDADAHYQNAKSWGAVIVEEFGDYEFIGAGYSCKDPEGHVWNFGTRNPRHLNGHTGHPSNPTLLNRLGHLIFVTAITLAAAWWMFGVEQQPSPSARIFDQHLLSEMAPAALRTPEPAPPRALQQARHNNSPENGTPLQENRSAVLPSDPPPQTESAKGALKGAPAEETEQPSENRARDPAARKGPDDAVGRVEPQIPEASSGVTVPVLTAKDNLVAADPTFGIPSAEPQPRPTGRFEREGCERSEELCERN